MEPERLLPVNSRWILKRGGAGINTRCGPSYFWPPWSRHTALGLFGPGAFWQPDHSAAIATPLPPDLFASGARLRPQREALAPPRYARGPRFPKGAERRGAARLRRQAQGSRPATPSGLEDGLSSSQYPWAIVWGPTISVEDGGDPNSANPGLPPLGYTFVSSNGMATAQPNSHSLLQNEGLNLRQTPATLRPFLFGPPGEGVDPQLYVTITISVIIVLVAMAIILKFCWDRNQKRRRHSSQQSGPQQQGSQQPLTDLSPGAVSILGSYGDSQTPPPEMTETGQVLEGLDKLEGTGKTSAFQLNR
ncbi:UNVERIFIED_CONTAM: hypothetical protein K2H54_024839 [Gekko kuhli]